MARYIDAELIDFSDLKNDFDRARAKIIIMGQPTADVVPKSEVEKLQNELVIWKQNRFNLYQKLECYEMARQKVAREIFEEIENRAFGFGVCFVEMTRTTFDELKKKYTESEGKG